MIQKVIWCNCVFYILDIHKALTKMYDIFLTINKFTWKRVQHLRPTFIWNLSWVAHSQSQSLRLNYYVYRDGNDTLCKGRMQPKAQLWSLNVFWPLPCWLFGGRSDCMWMRGWSAKAPPTLLSSWIHRLSGNVTQTQIPANYPSVTYKQKFSNFFLIGISEIVLRNLRCLN